MTKLPHPKHASLGQLHPIRPVNLVSEAVERLRELIITGEFGPDGALPTEGELCEAFGVSRTVIREAMRNLEAHGLVTVSRGRSPLVRPVDPQFAIDSVQTFLRRSEHTLIELLEVRRPLECEIAALAAERATAEDIVGLEQAIADLSTAEALSMRVESDMEFHHLLAEATHNVLFPVLLRSIVGMMQESLRTTLSKVGAERATVGHSKILQAVKQKSPDRARAAMEKHLAMALEDLKRQDAG